MKLHLLRVADWLVHHVIPPFVPFPAWALRVCNAYDREEFRE